MVGSQPKKTPAFRVLGLGFAFVEVSSGFVCSGRKVAQALSKVIALTGGARLEEGSALHRVVNGLRCLGFGVCAEGQGFGLRVLGVQP